VDWNEQAAKSAESYLDMTGFSRSGLIEQLEYEGYTTEQAEYGVDQTGL
jgi:Host cell surface-exposed lipoprotein